MVSKVTSLIKDEAFLIRSVAYGDDHLILSCLTREYGRVDLIALGAKKSRKRFGGVLDFLNHLELEFDHSSRGDLNRLVHCELKNSFPSILKNYQKTIVSLEWLRLLSRAIPLGGSVPGLFPILRACLKSLEVRDTDWVDLVFRRRVLTCLGYHLDLAKCRRCGKREGGPFYFDLSGGGLFCSHCKESGGFRVSACFPEDWWELERNRNPWEPKRLYEGQTILRQGYQEYLGVLPQEKAF